jgi:dipeptidyl aminopeptidase/acylaminoacyl peptidase
VTDANGGRTLFHDLGEYMAIPRIGSIRLSPDGTWLAAAVQTLSADKKKYLTSIWRIDPHGGPARRLTWSAEGEGNPAFLPDGSLLFISGRPDPGKDKNDADKPALWLLPAAGGEARVVGTLPGGITAATTARDSQAIAVSAPVLVQATTTDETSAAADDERLRKQREDAGVSAILHESAPVRYWDADLGPDHTRLFAFDQAREDQDEAQLAARDLTPNPGGSAFAEQTFDLTPDGTTLITGWWYRDPASQSHVELVAVDVATGKRRTLLSKPGHCFQFPHVSPDGRFVVCSNETLPAVDNPPDLTLMLVDLDGTDDGKADKAKDLLPDLDLWPEDAAWAPDSKTVYFVADDHGRCPVFKVDVATGATTRLTSGDHAYAQLNPSPDGRYLYALRNAVDEPPTPVRIDLTDPAGTAQQTLDSPGHPLELPGRLAELTTEADDGETIRSWLVLPHEARNDNPVPLVLWVHGGPNSSWNAWSWRWNPWLLAAEGYAVLLPDPALSTGYGQHMLQRGHHEWGERTFKDVMSATDAALKRDDIDGTKTAMMGGSYGGYMANWIAGHTDRFSAIVSHASLWVLDQMFSTTDEQMFWWGQFGDPLTSPAMYENNSPHLHVKNITTPMLVIHGDKDYRVPIGEALRLWGELTRHGVPAKFLYFPDENHWVLSPGNATVWYQTVYAFLAQHVLGQEWERPVLL